MPKSKKSKKGINEAKPVNILADKQLLVVIVVVFIICVLIGIKTVSSYVLSSNIAPTPTIDLPIPTLTPTDTPTPSPAPIYVPHYVAPTTDPDPIIDCNVTNIGTIKIKASQCSISFACEIGQGKWHLYTSKDKCTQDQNSYHNTPSNNYVPPVYVPPAYNPPTNNYQVPTGTYVAPTIDPQVAIDQHNKQVMYCQAGANQNGSDCVTGCNQAYGGSSSAGDACRYICESQRQSAYNACGSTN